MQIKPVRYGQSHRYGDTIEEYWITGGTREEIIKHFKLDPDHEKPNYYHAGSCGFPFGLNSFWTLDERADELNLQITFPCCD